MATRVLMVDNYDSFTYNLVQYLGELGAEIDVVRNDVATVDELLARAPDRVVVSPGPCTPAEAGISIDEITSKLVEDGVRQFADAADQLYAAVQKKRRTVLGGKLNTMSFKLPKELDDGVKADGTQIPIFGPNPVGSLIFTPKRTILAADHARCEPRSVRLEQPRQRDG